MLAVLKLVEEDRPSLDARVRDLVPELRFGNPCEATDPVRVVHLLERSTGWDDIPMRTFAHNDPTPATLVVVTVYLALGGWIGLRTWA